MFFVKKRKIAFQERVITSMCEKITVLERSVKILDLTIESLNNFNCDLLQENTKIKSKLERFENKEQYEKQYLKDYPQKYKVNQKIGKFRIACIMKVDRSTVFLIAALIREGIKLLSGTSTLKFPKKARWAYFLIEDGTNDQSVILDIHMKEFVKENKFPERNFHTGEVIIEPRKPQPPKEEKK